MSIQRSLPAWIAALALACAATAARADQKGEEVLRQAFKTLGAAKSYTADMTATMTSPGAPGSLTFKGTVKAMKPNFLRVEMKGDGGNLLFVADGKDYYVPGEGGAAEKMKLEAAPTEFQGMWEGEVDAFFGGEKNLAKVDASYAGTERVGGVECDLVKVKPKQMGARVTYAIGKEDHLIRRATITVPSQEGAAVTQTNTLTNIKLDPTLSKDDFKYTPPATGADAA